MAQANCGGLPTPYGSHDQGSRADHTGGAGAAFPGGESSSSRAAGEPPLFSAEGRRAGILPAFGHLPLRMRLCSVAWRAPGRAADQWPRKRPRGVQGGRDALTGHELLATHSSSSLGGCGAATAVIDPRSDGLSARAVAKAAKAEAMRSVGQMTPAEAVAAARAEGLVLETSDGTSGPKSATGLKGVRYDEQRGRYHAAIHTSSSTIFVSSAATAQGAALARARYIRDVVNTAASPFGAPAKRRKATKPKARPRSIVITAPTLTPANMATAGLYQPASLEV